MLCILKGEMPFKMHKMILFSTKKKKLKKYITYVPALPNIFRPVTRNTFYIWPYCVVPGQTNQWLVEIERLKLLYKSK